MRELNRRDPGWADKVRQKRSEDIQKLQNAKNMLTQEIEQRENQLRTDKIQDERLTRLKQDYQNEQERLAELVREESRRKTRMENEMQSTQKQIETIKAEAARVQERAKKETVDFQLEQESPTKTLGSIAKSSPEPTDFLVAQMNNKKSILRGEGYYSSNNSTAPVAAAAIDKAFKPETDKTSKTEKVAPVKVAEPIKVQPAQVNEPAKRKQPKAEVKVEETKLPSVIFPIEEVGSKPIDVEDSVDNEFNMLVAKKVESFSSKPD